MGEVSTIGSDLAKNVFQAHGADASGAVLFRKKLRRHQVLTFFAAQPPCTVAMEACGSSHHWAREIGRLGHTVRLIPPAYVKPFVKRQKNDAADAEAICEAAQRPTMRFVAPKSEQMQAANPDHQCPARSSGRVRDRGGQRAGSRSAACAGC
jgi:transposase